MEAHNGYLEAPRYLARFQQLQVLLKKITHMKKKPPTTTRILDLRSTTHALQSRALGLIKGHIAGLLATAVQQASAPSSAVRIVCASHGHVPD
jgi:hypothetical protein